MAGHGLTSPAGVHANTVGSETATSTPPAKAISRGRWARRRSVCATAAPIAQMSDCAAARSTSAR